MKIAVESYDRSGLLRDISAVLDKAGLNILAMSSRSDQGRKGVSVRMEVTLEVMNINELSNVMTKLRQIPNVTGLQRIDEG